MNRVILLAALASATPAAPEEFKTDPDGGNNVFTAVFDAKVGERITAQSSAVACDLTYDAKAGTASGTCSVPLTSIKVDNEDTKTEHFQQWVTNKKSEPKDCRFEAKFAGVKVGTLVPEQPASFTAQVPFTVCGRGPVDGRKEQVKGTALLFPPGSYGEKKTIRIRASVPNFVREAYHIGPKYTEGWFARVQSLAKVVAESGSIELSLFAKSQTDDQAASSK
jgi:hypothetical protein